MSSYPANIAVIKEIWTRKGGRIEIRHKDREIFEFDSSSEHIDQLRNARCLAKQLLAKGDVLRIVDETSAEEIALMEIRKSWAANRRLTVRNGDSSRPKK